MYLARNLWSYFCLPLALSAQVDDVDSKHMLNRPRENKFKAKIGILAEIQGPQVGFFAQKQAGDCGSLHLGKNAQ